MNECCKKTPKAPPPSCCSSKKKYNESDDSWKPNAESSLIEDEEFPEMSLLDDTMGKGRRGNAGDTFISTDDYLDMSPIPSEKTFERPKAVGNRTVTLPKVQGKVDDISVIYSPLPPPRGTYSQSRSFAQSSPTWTRSSEGYDSGTYNESRDYTDLGPWKNFHIPANIDRRNIPAGAHKSFPRTQVPRPSRNYSTYEDPQEILDVKEVADHWKKMPRYFSTPKSPGPIPWKGLDESTLWGQDLSSFDPTNSEPWSQGVRMDSFNVLKYMTPSPKNVKVPPRLNQSYVNAAGHQMMSPFPGRAYQSQPRPTGPDYSYFHRRYAAESPQMQGTFTQSPHLRPNLTRTQKPCSAQVNSTFARLPTPAKLQSTFVQRPQTSQMNATFARPNLTQPINCSSFNATRERPQSAQICSPHYSQKSIDSPISRPRTAGPTPQPTEIEPLNRTFDLSTTFDRCPAAVPTGQELAPFGSVQNLGQNFDTLLEIRTPRMPGGSSSNSPVQLSINVTCTERTLLVTPEKRYSMLEASPESRSPNNECSGGRNNYNLTSRCCQCN